MPWLKKGKPTPKVAQALKESNVGCLKGTKGSRLAAGTAKQAMII